MIKKVLLIAAFIIFAVSCSKTPRDPNSENNNGGSTGQNKDFPELKYISA